MTVVHPDDEVAGPDEPLEAPTVAAATRVGRRRRIVIVALKVGVSAALIAWVLSRADLGDVLGAMAGADRRLLVLAALLQPVGVVIASSRWQGLLAAQGTRASIPFLAGSHFVAGFFRQFLPSTIGGDAVRAYDCWRAGASKSVSVATVAVDRLLGLLVLALFATAAIPVARGASAPPLLLAAAALASLGLLVVVWLLFAHTPRASALVDRALAPAPRAVRRLWEKAASSVTAFRGQRRVFARAFALSVLLQLNVVVFYFAIAQALSLTPGLRDFFFIVPTAIFIMMVPVSINGIGLREAAFALLLGACGATATEAVALAWLEYGIFLAFGLLGGVVYALRR